MKGRTFGPYTILGEIARGGMAAVFAAEHQDLHHRTALKILHAQFRNDRKVRSRFLEEARLLANIRHPNILEVRDILESKDLTAIVMELLVGSTLQQYNRVAGLPRPLPELLKTYQDITRALAVAHEKGVIHRDMKPSNIFLNCDEDTVTPKLMDFGIAKLPTQGGEALTSTGALLGTPQYMAPEQFRDSSKVDPRADIFALGVMMYEGVTGRLPFSGDAVTEVMHKILHEEPQAPSLVLEGVPESMETVILSCLRKNRDQRYGSVAQLHMALKRLVGEIGEESIHEDRVPRAGWSDFDEADTAFASLSAEEFFSAEAVDISEEPTRSKSNEVSSISLPEPEPVSTPLDQQGSDSEPEEPTSAKQTRISDDDLPGYKIAERIYQGTETQVYRALHMESRRFVMVKVLAADYPDPDQVARLTHEYEVAKDLNIDGVVRVLSLERFRNSLALVTEDFGGEPLRDFIDSERPGLAEVLAIGTRMSVVLDQLHRREVVHKDINPKNIVRNPTTGETKLIDFGLAMVQRGRQQAIDVRTSLEGTLAYISPEQTGRMNRAVDYRSDYYSLGVTLYELLTGRLPFESRDRAELVHCHIARAPRPPAVLDPNIPGIVSDLVMKLIAKNAEDRFQSARGLRADLEECSNQLREAGVIAEFPLGRHDVSDRFQIPEKLYGRDEQVAVLMDAFKRIRQGFQEFLVVAGYSGIGKTSLVNEIYKPVSRERGYFLTGKFDQYKRDIPYCAVIEAFQGLVKELLSQHETELKRWKDDLTEALGPNGQVVIEVIPEIELIIGAQPEIPELPPAESHNRFNLVFQNFISVFARADHPLVLFLDDLQWADNASLNLVRTLMTGVESRFLLIIGAYRDNEVDAKHPLTAVMDEVQRAGSVIDRIELGPLDLLDVNQLIADTLVSSLEHARLLAELLHNRTQGNPFFLVEFLKSLHHRGLLTFDHGKGRWLWSLGEIQAVGIDDDVVDLMAGRIERLDAPSKQALKLAACIGAHFPLHLLGQVTGRSPSEVMGHLKAAVSEGLVVLLGDAYKYLELDGDTLGDGLLDAVLLRSVRYKFSHDRIQQAAYSLIPEEARTTLHRQIGQILLRETPQSQREQRIFDIVNQLNSSVELIEGLEDREELARLNLLAGQKAKNSAAYKSSHLYLKTGIDLLMEDCWDRQYDLALALHTEAAEAAYLVTEFDEMDRLVSLIREHARSDLDQVRPAEILIAGFIAQARKMDAVNTALEILRLLKVNVPSQPKAFHVVRQLLLTKLALLGKSPETLVDHRISEEPRIQAALRIIGSIGSTAYVVYPNLFPVLICKGVELSVRFGHTQHSPFAYSLYGTVLCGALGDLDGGYRFGKLALALLDKLDVRDIRQRTTFTFAGTTQHFKEPTHQTVERLLDGYRRSLETGDFEFVGANTGVYTYHQFYSGLPLEPLYDELDSYVTILEQTRQDAYHRYLAYFRQTMLNLMGRSEDPLRLTGEACDGDALLESMEASNDAHGMFGMYLNRMVLEVLLGTPAEASRLGDLAEKHWFSAMAMVPSLVYFFWDSLARLGTWPVLDPPARRRLRRRVRKNQRKLAKWAKHAPSNHRHRWLLVEAERQRVEGSFAAASERYDEAIEAARDSGNLGEHALANELAARAYLENNKSTIARTYMSEAHYGYRKWGANAKVSQIEEEHQDLLIVGAGDGFLASSVGATSTSSSSSSSTATGSRLDLSAVLKAASVLAGEIRLERLLESMLRIVIENGGAEKGILLLEEEERLVVQAEALVDRDEVEVLQKVPLRDREDLAQSVVNYVMRTKETVVLDDAARAGSFARDTYILDSQPRSVLCTPLLHQGKLAGILYLENNLSPGAFTPARVEMLNMLSSEIVVSLENARLYGALEEYSRGLEQKVRERTKELSRTNAELSREKQKADDLLLNVLPVKVAEDLKREGRTEPEHFDAVTVFFSDFVDFTHIAEGLDPKALINELNELFTAFDNIVETNGCERIKTIGDAYMFVCGMPEADPAHARKAVQAASDILAWLEERNETNSLSWKIRMGLHSGPVVGGVVGVKKYIYDVFGDTINTASRMESMSDPMHINLSEATWEQVKDNVNCTPREPMEIKGKGTMRMFFVD